MIDETPRDPAKLIAELLAGASDEQHWLSELHIWRQTGKWDRGRLGPAPGEANCRVPSKLLRPNGTVVARKGPAPSQTAGELVERLAADMARRAA